MDKSTSWSVYGGVSLLAALTIAAISITHTSPDLADDIPIANVVFLLVKGTFFMGIAGIISRYAFILSKRYLGESLRVSDIIHGVSFGQMYVQSYGATAGWDQVKDAFSKWHDMPVIERENTEKRHENEGDFDDSTQADMLPKIYGALKDLKTLAAKDTPS